MGLGDAVGGIIKGAGFVAKCERTIKVGKAVSATCRMVGAVAQTGVNAINFDRAFRSVRQEYRETGHVSFLNGANAALSALGVVGGVAQSVNSIRSFNRMRSSLSSKASLSSGSSQPYANIADGVCFVAGTQVKTEAGRKAIEAIEAGDLVYAKDTESGEEGYKEVVRVFKKETKELLHLWIGDTEIDTTPNHPFWIEGYGFREAGELQEGDKVLNADGEVLTVARVELEILEEPVRVYNFEVADWHTYYVSDEEVLVHNTCAVGGSRTGMASPYDLTPTHSQTLSKKNMNKLIEDIKDNGINETIKYIEYNSQKYIVDGHHRLIAAKRLGLKEVPIEKVELPYAGYKTVEDLLWLD
ncbi:MAG: polymorphic toxin-type HINT domain-containing protein [Roseburia sp.]|nr:polymorphic toxin-type HINT domain-containing protein [Roseburia sp.]MCM1279110.1 polymorphic toxin-type HINT domain-containing protein [Robinsoniella sp.]